MGLSHFFITTLLLALCHTAFALDTSYCEQVIQETFHQKVYGPKRAWVLDKDGNIKISPAPGQWHMSQNGNTYTFDFKSPGPIDDKTGKQLDSVSHRVQVTRTQDGIVLAEPDIGSNIAGRQTFYHELVYKNNRCYLRSAGVVSTSQENKQLRRYTP